MRLWSYPAPRKLVARRGGKGASAAQPVDDEESPGGWGIDMDAMGRRAEDARAELEGIRDRVADMSEIRHEGFVAHVLGRELGEPEQGVFADAIWGRARGRAFSERRCSWGAHHTCRFEVSTFTEPAAAILDRTWCSKLQRFFGVGQSQPAGPLSQQDRHS